MKQIKPEPLALSIISGSEFGALVTGLWPTWTSLWKRLPKSVRRVLRPVLVAGIAVWAWIHFE